MKGMAALVLGAVAGLGPTAGPAHADVGRIATTIRSLASHGPRMAGYGGIRFAADLIEGELRRAGVQRVARERLEVAVPVDHGASIHILGDDREIPLHSLWPNLVRTTSLGPDGIEGELLYGAHGEPVSLNGKVVEGSVVLLEFNSWDRWRNAASLGARAVIFIAPERTTLFEARRKWAWVPLDVPRFWLERRAGLALKSRLDREELRVHLESRMTWERHDTWNIWGVVPGIDADLRDEWIAVQSYYDGTSVVPALAPSAQTAAGIAALLELAHYLRAHPPARSVVLIATGAHFLNSVGLRDFLSRHARRNPYFRERAHQRVVAADSLEAPETVELLKGHGLLPDSSRPRPGDNDAGPRSGYWPGSMDASSSDVSDPEGSPSRSWASAWSRTRCLCLCSSPSICRAAATRSACGTTSRPCNRPTGSSSCLSAGASCDMPAQRPRRT